MTTALTSKTQFAINISSKTEEMVNDIRQYIEQNDCPNLSLDISNLNLIDASKATILCSTYHWAKYPKGKINLFTSTPEVKNIVNSLNLGNVILKTL